MLFNYETGEKKMDYNLIKLHNFISNKTKTLKSWHPKLCVTSSCQGEGGVCKLWCASGDNGLYLYNNECDLLENVKSPAIDKVDCISQLEDGHVVVGCNFSTSEGQLLELNSSGEYVKKIAEGAFSDVCYDRVTRLIYAVQPKLKLLLVFETIQGTWLQVRVLRSVITDPLDTVAAHNDVLYVCCHKERLLRLYRCPDAHMLSQTRTRGKDQLLSPRLCDIDDHGNVLVCDWMNHKVHIYHRESDTWTLLSTKGVRYPVDVKIINNVDSSSTKWELFTLTHGVSGSDSNQLIKFIALNSEN